MKRRLCQTAAVVCLLFCGATLGMWARSETVTDELIVIVRADPNWTYIAESERGVLVLAALNEPLLPAPAVVIRHWRGGNANWCFGGYRFCGFGWNDPDVALDGYGMCVPHWFTAVLWLVVAYIFTRIFRRAAGRGFPILPRPPKATP